MGTIVEPVSEPDVPLLNDGIDEIVEVLVAEAQLGQDRLPYLDGRDRWKLTSLHLLLRSPAFRRVLIPHFWYRLPGSKCMCSEQSVPASFRGVLRQGSPVLWLTAVHTS